MTFQYIGHKPRPEEGYEDGLRKACVEGTERYRKALLVSMLPKKYKKSPEELIQETKLTTGLPYRTIASMLKMEPNFVNRVCSQITMIGNKG